MWQTTPEAQSWIEHGMLHETRRQYSEAERSYRFAVAASPQDQLARFRLANLLWHTERLEEAQKEFESLLTIVDHPVVKAELSVIKGRIAANEGNYQVAYNHFDAAAQIFNEFNCSSEYQDILLKACEGMGNAKYKQGQRLTALVYYRKALALAGKDNQIQLHNLALCLANIGFKHEAAHLFKRALKQGDDADCWLGLGDIYCQWEKFKPAVEYYRKALDTEPNHADAHYALGCCLAMMGEFKQARVHLERAFSLGMIEADDLLRDLDLRQFVGKQI